MEIGLKEWLIIGGILVIGLIIFDGWRRKRGQRDTLKINIDGSLSDSPEDDHNPELPNGGARIKKHEAGAHDYLGLSASDSDYEPKMPYADEIEAERLKEEQLKADLLNEEKAQRELHALDPHVTETPESDPLTAVDTAQVYDQSDDTITEPLNERYSAPETDETSIHETSFEAKPLLSEQAEEVDMLPVEEPLIDSNPRDASDEYSEIRVQDAELHFEKVVESHSGSFIEHVSPEPTLSEHLDSQEVLNETQEPQAFEPEPEHEYVAPKENHRSGHQRIEPSFSMNEPEKPEPSKPESFSTEPVKAKAPETRVQKPIHELDPLFDDIPDELLDEPVIHETANEDVEPYEPPVTAQAEEPLVPKDDDSTALSGNDWVEDTPEQADPRGSVDFDQPITVLMRQVSENAAKRDQRIKQPAPKPVEEAERVQHEMFDWDIDDEDSDDAVSLRDHAQESLTHEPELQSEKPKKKGKKKKAKEKPIIEEDIPEQDSLFHDPLVEEARTSHRAIQHVPDPEDVLVITVVGNEHPLNGRTLLEVVVACGMRHGDMDLFHRFEDGLEKGAVQFSMANAVNPGTFDLDTMSDMVTKGVSFFMSMSEPKDPKTAFDCMLATAETVAKHLNGDLLDENRSVMRPQTKMHYRERIREFELHKRARQGRPDMV